MVNITHTLFLNLSVTTKIHCYWVKVDNPHNHSCVRNSRIEESLNRKTKPRYIGPMVVVRKTIGTSYVVTELDGTESQLRVAGFRLIPYFPRTSTSILIISDVAEDKDYTEDDPEDIRFLSNLSSDSSAYHFVSPPKF